MKNGVNIDILAKIVFSLLFIPAVTAAEGVQLTANSTGNSTFTGYTETVEDWPMYRYDVRRGAATAHQLSDELHLNWVIELPEPKRAWPPQADDFDKLEFDLSYEPVVAGDLIFVPSMVSDKLVAYHIETGEKVWDFFTNGPIRVAPVVADGRIYLPSDDGYLYCLKADDGELIWKFRGGPTDRLVLGNERLINMWSIRGGPVIKDGTIYFAAGFWPHEGVFIHALNAETGDKVWTNSGTGNRMDLHPHGGAYSFGGVAPQGSFVVSGDKLIVPGGRTSPAVFNRYTGEMLYFRYEQQTGKGGGGYRVYANDNVYFNPDIYINQMYSLADGTHLDEVNAHVVANDTLYGIDEQRVFGQVLQSKKKGDPIYGKTIDEIEQLHVLAGKRLYGSGNNGMIAGIDVKLELDAPSEERLVTTMAWQEQVDGEVFRMIAARDRLFVVTTKGRIYCFGQQESDPTVHEYHPDPIQRGDDEWTARAGDLLETSGATNGYALMFGIGSGRLLEELLLQSDLHIVAFDPDESVVRRMRETFVEAGLYGKRVAVHQGDAFSHRLPDYIASLIVSEDPEAAGLEAGEAFAEAIFQPLRPYGGTIYLPIADRSWYHFFAADEQAEFVEAAEQAELENAVISKKRDHVLVSRPGSLPGSDVWSHQYSDAANTTYSADERVFTPLGITWFGGPSNEKTLPRHIDGPVPQVVEGRLVILGVDHISARCVYTGREMWSVELPLIGENFTSLEQEAQPSPVRMPKHPGANFIGSPYVTTSEAVYLIYQDRTLKLDLETGKQLAAFDLPDYSEMPDNTADDVMDEFNESYAAQIAEEDKKRWGHILVSGEYLIVGAYPHFFDKRQPGKVGNWNATSSEYLLVMNRHNGEIKWVHQASYGFRHNAIAATDDRIFVMDNLSSEIHAKLERRGIIPDIEPEIRALDMESGRLLWRYDEDVFGTWLSYSQQHDVLLQAGRRGGNRSLGDERGDRMLVLRGEDGVKLWDYNERHTGPVALHDEQCRVISGKTERSRDLKTGEIYRVPNPISGELETWRYNHTYGCGTQNVSKNLITFRSGAAGYTDLRTGSETGNLAGFRAGCINNLVVADGVLNAPDYTRTCTCSYQHQTSLAFVHMPEVEKWTYNTYSDPEPGTIKRFGLNLGAPGSRIEDEIMWIKYPYFSDQHFSRWDRKYRVPVPNIPVEISCVENEKDLQWNTGHALEIEKERNGYRWVAASSVEGIGRIQVGGLYNNFSNPENETTYTVRLHFAEPKEIAAGRRVFDVLLQGETVVKDLDIVEATGGNRRIYIAEITGMKPDDDGNMTLEFIKAQGSTHLPLLSGVDVKLEE